MDLREIGCAEWNKPRDLKCQNVVPLGEPKELVRVSILKNTVPKKKKELTWSTVLLTILAGCLWIWIMIEAVAQLFGR